MSWSWVLDQYGLYMAANKLTIHGGTFKATELRRAYYVSGTMEPLMHMVPPGLLPHLTEGKKREWMPCIECRHQSIPHVASTCFSPDCLADLRVRLTEAGQKLLAECGSVTLEDIEAAERGEPCYSALHSVLIIIKC